MQGDGNILIARLSDASGGRALLVHACQPDSRALHARLRSELQGQLGGSGAPPRPRMLRAMHLILRGPFQDSGQRLDITADTRFEWEPKSPVADRLRALLAKDGSGGSSGQQPAVAAAVAEPAPCPATTELPSQLTDASPAMHQPESQLTPMLQTTDRQLMRLPSRLGGGAEAAAAEPASSQIGNAPFSSTQQQQQQQQQMHRSESVPASQSCAASQAPAAGTAGRPAAAAWVREVVVALQRRHGLSLATAKDRLKAARAAYGPALLKLAVEEGVAACLAAAPSEAPASTSSDV